MTLIELIERIGTQKLATRLGVDRVTVWNWGRGDGIPKAETARKIVKTFPDLISYEEIFEPYFQAREQADDATQLAFDV
jgi:DNA-binding XRE family transcriptional regulator